MDLKASTDPASLIGLGRLFHYNGAGETNALLPADLLVNNQQTSVSRASRCVGVPLGVAGGPLVVGAGRRLGGVG